MFDMFFNTIFADPTWSFEVFGNSLQTYAVAVAYVVGWLIIFKIITVILIARIDFLTKKTASDLDDQILAVVRSIRPQFYIYLSLYLAAQVLTLPETVFKILDGLLILAIVYQVIKIVRVFIEFGLKKKFGEEEIKTRSAVNLLSRLIAGALWIIGLILILSNMGVDVTSLVAGLGIGGLAVALALQNILSDLFAAFMIYFDKPFEIGDFVVVGEHAGTVKAIGIRSTRIKSLQGEEIIISNKEMTSVRIQNFKKLRERRVVTVFGVTYDTDNKKMGRVSEIAKQIIDDLSTVRFDRCHFKEFADSSLNFELVYFVDSADYNEYMDLQQQILLTLKGQLEKEKIGMAFPTRTVYLHKT